MERYLRTCHCGKPGLEEHAVIYGGKRIWTHIYFCSAGDKRAWLEYGDREAATRRRGSRNQLRDASYPDSRGRGRA